MAAALTLVVAVALAADCQRDEVKGCRARVAQGECHSNSDWMREKCCMSCIVAASNGPHRTGDGARKASAATNEHDKPASGDAEGAAATRAALTSMHCPPSCSAENLQSAAWLLSHSNSSASAALSNTWQRLMRLQQMALVQLVRDAGPIGPPPRSPECRKPTGSRSFDRLIRERLRLDRRPLVAAMSDKVLLRRYGEARSGPPAEVRPPELLFAGYGMPDCARLPRVGSLPPDYVFKASHRSSCVLLVINGAHVAPPPFHMPCSMPMSTLTSRSMPTWPE